jgi:osmotically-inducible protein OsmY
MRQELTGHPERIKMAESRMVTATIKLKDYSDSNEEFSDVSEIADEVKDILDDESSYSVEDIKVEVTEE